MEPVIESILITHGENLQIIIFICLFIVFIVLERFWPRRNMNRDYRRIRTNVLMTLAVVLTLPLLPISIISAAFWAESNAMGVMNNLSIDLPTWVAVLVTFIARALISYIAHLLNHKVPIFWRLHRVHHMDRDMDVTTTVRFHPLEMVASAVVSVPLIIGFGLPPWILLAYELLDASVTLFSHSNLKLPAAVEKWLSYIIVTPGLHTIHHSDQRHQTDTNYSAVFPLWDLVFGTYRKPSIVPNALGVEEFNDPEVNRFGWLLISPFLVDRSTNESAG